MNWSGGALSRSRSSKTSRLAAQKRNFAKAKKLPQARQSFADFDFSTLEHARIEIEKEVPLRQSPARSPQPLRNTSRGTTSSRKKQVKSRPPAWSPSFCPSSWKQNNTSGPGTIERDMNISAEARLEAQKQELLAMKDWCGLKITRPVKISFPDIADVDLIGKRRPVLKANPERASRNGEKRPSIEAGADKTLKKRKIYLDEDSDTSYRKDKSDFPRRDVSCAEGIAMDVEQNSRCSNSDEMLLDTIMGAKYSGASFNSDENLFDVENASQTFGGKISMHMSLSPQNSATFRPSPLKNEINGVDLACDESDGQFDAVSELSHKDSLESWEGRIDSRFLAESPVLIRDDSPSSFHVCSHVQHEADYNTAEPHQNDEPSARWTRSRSESEFLGERVTPSPALYDHCPSDACIGIPTAETNLHPTPISHTNIPTTLLMEDTPPLQNQHKSSLASATLSDVNELTGRLIGHASTSASHIQSRAEVTDQFELLPSRCDPTRTVIDDSSVLAPQEPRTAAKEKSPSPETVWRNFVLGNSDDESIDDPYEFTLPTSPGSRCPPEAAVNMEPCSMKAEPSRSLRSVRSMSTDELTRLPPRRLQPTTFFTKPKRFQGEGTDAPTPPIRLGGQRRSAMTSLARLSDEDDITDD